MRAPQDIIIMMLSFGRIMDTKAGGKSVCMNYYQGEYNNEHASNWYTHIVYARAKVRAQVHVPRVIVRVVGDDNHNPIKTTPVEEISTSN